MIKRNLQENTRTKRFLFQKRDCPDWDEEDNTIEQNKEALYGLGEENNFQNPNETRWQCDECGFKNFLSRRACFHCKERLPEIPFITDYIPKKLPLEENQDKMTLRAMQYQTKSQSAKYIRNQYEDDSRTVNIKTIKLKDYQPTECIQKP